MQWKTVTVNMRRAINDISTREMDRSQVSFEFALNKASLWKYPLEWVGLVVEALALHQCVLHGFYSDLNANVSGVSQEPILGKSILYSSPRDFFPGYQHLI